MNLVTLSKHLYVLTGNRILTHLKNNAVDIYGSLFILCPFNAGTHVNSRPPFKNSTTPSDLFITLVHLKYGTT